MLALTTLGVAASFHPKVRNIKGTYDAGQYFILVFSLALGTNINFREMFVSSSAVFVDYFHGRDLWSGFYRPGGGAFKQSGGNRARVDMWFGRICDR